VHHKRHPIVQSGYGGRLNSSVRRALEEALEVTPHVYELTDGLVAPYGPARRWTPKTLQANGRRSPPAVGNRSRENELTRRSLLKLSPLSLVKPRRVPGRSGNRPTVRAPERRCAQCYAELPGPWPSQRSASRWRWSCRAPNPARPES